ncbi:3-methyladenine DNA glycosylase/8-oxoguanine DNAglycosylase [Halanaeroarchaeum sp. HSR-CO]|uniref:DNA-3-methyladenine glycosylase family protein n=1 Tax=Halanaeroarchaeum sp. HSR-CO TaxID=2866382 RepID=UPI00217E71FA|nr:DNA-3-methyladenine glycosylase 2 family protein [Halanaeroarchaeum sp. HSR-CO]UWG48409.1 3-methyladenine DNA glycosylase/8-oxoguanine DNAglycosylase [Halanaeroarchaeum sp. HSR-CO]
MSDPIDALRSDPHLGTVVEDHGPISVEPAPDAFERLLSSIVRQQVSMDAAAAIEGRLFDRVDPTPASILEADPDAMREAGLSAAKTEYVRNLADAWLSNGWCRSYFADKTDDAVIDELTTVKGVGVWTGKMFLLFGLGREDIFPVEDLGIRNAMWDLVDEDLTRAEMVETATAWAPYRSYASEYLWRTID